MQYLEMGFYPVLAPLALNIAWRGKLSTVVWSELTGKHKTKSFRSLAKEYGVSYETVRRMIKSGQVKSSLR